MIIIVVKKTSKQFVLKLKFEDEKTLGIIKKITNGFVTPPVKYNKDPNCNISITRKIKADLSDN
tara:strand:- start:394 stop:585 length:192 start_codon:yes stop_codon:yes gene_type:complete